MKKQFSKALGAIGASLIALTSGQALMADGIHYDGSGAHYHSQAFNGPVYEVIDPDAAGHKASTFLGLDLSGTGLSNPFFNDGTGYSYVRADFGRFDRSATYTSAAGTNLVFSKPQNYIGGRFGQLFNRNFGLEARLALSSDEEVQPIGALSSPVSRFGVTAYGGVFGRYQHDMGYGFLPYVNLGLAASRREFSSTNGSTDLASNNTDFGIAGAVGLEVNFASNMVFGIDYHVMPSSVKGLGVSLGYNF